MDILQTFYGASKHNKNVSRVLESAVPINAETGALDWHYFLNHLKNTCNPNRLPPRAVVALMRPFFKAVVYPPYSEKFSNFYDPAEYNTPLVFSSGGRKLAAILTPAIEYKGEKYANPLYEFAIDQLQKQYPEHPFLKARLPDGSRPLLRISLKGIGSTRTPVHPNMFENTTQIEGFTALEQSEIEIPQNLLGTHTVIDEERNPYTHFYIPGRVMLARIPIKAVVFPEEEIAFVSTAKSPLGRDWEQEHLDKRYPLATGDNQLQILIYAETGGPDWKNMQDMTANKDDSWYKNIIRANLGWHPFFQELMQRPEGDPKMFVLEFVRLALRKAWYDAQVETTYKLDKNRSLQNTLLDMTSTDFGTTTTRESPYYALPEALRLWYMKKDSFYTNPILGSYLISEFSGMLWYIAYTGTTKRHY